MDKLSKMGSMTQILSEENLKKTNWEIAVATAVITKEDAVLIFNRLMEHDKTNSWNESDKTI